MEDTGRYGGIGVATGRTIEVTSLGINEVLERALGSRPRIDVLKIDTEGTELEILGGVRPEPPARVRTVYLETGEPPAGGPGTSFEAALPQRHAGAPNRRAVGRSAAGKPPGRPLRSPAERAFRLVRCCH